MEALGTISLPDTAFLWGAVALLPLLFGGGLLKFFREWAYTEKELKEKLRGTKQTLIERSAKAHDNLIFRTNLGEPTRGDGKGPDLLAEYAGETYRINSLQFRCETYRVEARAGYASLWLTVILGLAALVVAIVATVLDAPLVLPYIIGIAIVLLFLQVVIFAWLRHLSHSVDELDESI